MTRRSCQNKGFNRISQMKDTSAGIQAADIDLDDPSGGDGHWVHRRRMDSRRLGARFVVRFRIMAGRSVNKVILLGHLGRDAETRYTTSGVPVSRFTLATNRRVKDSQTGDWKDETDWHNITLWRSENLAPYLTKGKQVYIEGSLRTRSWDDKEGQKRYTTEVVVDDIVLVGGQGGQARGEESQESRPRGPAAGPKPERGAPPAPPADDFGPGITDDDVPF